VRSDAEAERLYEQLVGRLGEAGMVIGAYGGVATIAIPSEQRKVDGLRRQVLDAIEKQEAKR
jgi:hypothetical protein